MRLTKDDLDKQIVLLRPREIGKTLIAVAINELREYKSIEEELGIDLMTLIKALKNGIYSSFVDSSNKRIILKSNKVLLLKTLDGLDCFFEDNDERVLLFSDYGKTWALTKEELL